MHRIQHIAIALFILAASAGIARALTDEDTGYNLNSGGSVRDMVYEGTWFGYEYERNDVATTGVGGSVRYDNLTTDLVSESSRIMFEFSTYLPFGETVINVYEQPVIGRQTNAYQITVSQTPEAFLQGKFNAFVRQQNGIYCRKFGC